MATIKWKRPSGTFIETNATVDSIQAAAAAGWVRVGGDTETDAPAEPAPKKGKKQYSKVVDEEPF